VDHLMDGGVGGGALLLDDEGEFRKPLVVEELVERVERGPIALFDVRPEENREDAAALLGRLASGRTLTGKKSHRGPLIPRPPLPGFPCWLPGRVYKTRTYSMRRRFDFKYCITLPISPHMGGGSA